MLCRCSWHHTVEGTMMSKTLCRHKFVFLKMFSLPSPPPSVGTGIEGLSRSGPPLLMWVRTFRHLEPRLTFLHISPTFTRWPSKEHPVNVYQQKKMMQSQREVHFALRSAFYKEKWNKKHVRPGWTSHDCSAEIFNVAMLVKVAQSQHQALKIISLWKSLKFRKSGLSHGMFFWQILDVIYFPRLLHTPCSVFAKAKKDFFP